MNTLRQLQRYMGSRRWLLPLSLLLSAASAVAGLLPFVLIWDIVKELLDGGGTSASPHVAACAWWAAGLAAGSVVLYFLALMASHLAAFRVESNLRREAMRRVVAKPLGFFDSHTSGGIRKVIDDNAGITHSFLAHQLPDLAGTVLAPLATVALIFCFNWQLGLVCVLPFVLALLLMGCMMGTKGREFMRLYMAKLEEMNTEAVEYVRGIPVVKVFQQTIYSFKNFHRCIMEYNRMALGYTLMWEKPMSLYTVVINGFVFFLAPVALLLVAGGGSLAGVLADFFLFALLTPVFSQNIMKSMYLAQAFGQASEALGRMEHLLGGEEEEVDAASAPVPRDASIEFRHVSFSYEGRVDKGRGDEGTSGQGNEERVDKGTRSQVDQPAPRSLVNSSPRLSSTPPLVPSSPKKAVDDVSFFLPSGKTFALVGASGGGKTTIARLVPRFWQADEGEVLIGGVDVRALPQAGLMERVSFVFQNTRLFKTTLLENIRYGRPDATMDEVMYALERTCCRDIIDRLPCGLDTRIGAEGTYLSGGEQQRIALARALLKDAPIVVLDEATAFADPENESLIRQALAELTRGKTVLMIAHRLTTVTGADRILVIDHGRIAEQGTHTELLAQGGLYARMWDEYQQSVNWRLSAG